jgi:ribosomal protein L12E/L44/L45/RPP1/RPP2
MKKLLTLLFALAVAFSLSMPVFAQEAAGQEAAPKAEKKEKKAKKAPKAKKAKKEKKEEKKAGEGQ